MVKINTICKSKKDNQRNTKFDLFKIKRTIKPNIHLFEKPREFQRALLAAKIEKIFAKPFLYDLKGHSDGISTFTKFPNKNSRIASGGFDGNIFLWDLESRKKFLKIDSFENQVKGLSIGHKGNLLFSNNESLIKIYDIQSSIDKYIDNEDFDSNIKLVSKHNLNNLDCRYDSDIFATSGEFAQIWNLNRSIPIQTCEWGIDSIMNLKFNKTETNLILMSSIDRGIFIYDMRGKTNLQKIQMMNKSSCLCWNPQEPFCFIVGNEDSNIYSFDMRKMNEARKIYKGHINAVLDLDYAPTGKHFVSGSFDNTVRIWEENNPISKDVYHGKRMQKLFTIGWSNDNKYIFSGSEDFKIRVWKSFASDKLSPLNFKEKMKKEYRKKLIEKFKHVNDIKKICKSHLPKYIKNRNKQNQIVKESKFRKEENMKLFNEEVYEKPLPERSRKITNLKE